MAKIDGYGGKGGTPGPFRGSLTLVVTPCARQSGEFLRKAKEFARRSGFKARGGGHNDISIAFPDGSRIVGLPENETTIRGFSDVSLLLIDEAAHVSDEIYRAMRPTLVAHDGDLWLMSAEREARVLLGGMGSRGRRVGADPCAGFRQEYLCEFVDMEEALFPRELIDAAFENFEPI